MSVARSGVVGATLVVARAEHPGRLGNGTGQARPLRRSLHVGGAAGVVGATLVVARAEHRDASATGRDKPVPYGTFDDVESYSHGLPPGNTRQIVRPVESVALAVQLSPRFAVTS